MKWPYEHCDNCKREQRIAWAVSDETWLSVMGKEHSKIICFECFLKKADERKINITRVDITFLGWIGVNVIGDRIIDESPSVRK